MESCISIIVPVYNSENYLESCIKSVINQTYKNIQIILIDDGSTDQSAYIIDQYQKFDRRIVVIHQENAGVSCARNKGLSIAVGEWIMFVDSDDFIDKDYCENMLHTTCKMNVDVLIENSNNTDFKYYYEDNKNNLIKSCLSYDEQYPFNIDAPWGKIFRIKVIKENNIQFPTSLKRSEDAYFCMNVYHYANRIGIINTHGYQYNVHNDSLSKHFSKELISTLKEVLMINKQWVDDYYFNENDFYNALWFHVLPGIVECENYYYLHSLNQLSICRNAIEYQHMLNDSIIKKAIKSLKLKNVNNHQYKIRLIMYKLKLGWLFLVLKRMGI